MNTRPMSWRRRTLALLFASLLQAMFVAAFLHALTLRSKPIVAAPLQVHIFNPPVSPAAVPPLLHAPPLAIAPLPVLVTPIVSLPSLAAVPSVSAPESGEAGETAPQYIAAPLDADALYPAAARRTSAQGRVWTQVCVYSSGEIASVALRQSSGDSELDQAALMIARQSRWKPAMVNGKPVARCGRFRVDFSLLH